MNLLSLASQIGMIAVFIGIGALLHRMIDFQENVKKAFMTVLIYAAMPAIILDSIFQLPITEDLLMQVLLVFAVSVLIQFSGIFIGWITFKIAKKPRQRRNELAILSGLGNSGFLGIPICALLFGPKGALLAAVFDMGLDVAIWTICIYMLKGEEKFSWKPLKSMLNFPFMAMMTGLALALLGFRPPQFIAETLGILSGLTVPLAMIFIGLMLMQIVKSGNLTRMREVAGTLPLKLILLPSAVIMALFLLFQAGTALPWETAGVFMVQAAMPTFTFAAVIFIYCSADEELAALASVSSTVCSLLTVPLIVSFGSWLLF